MAKKKKAKQEVVELNEGATEEDIVSNVQQALGEESCFLLGTGLYGSQNIPVIPTGAPSVDKALGVGGVPQGRIVEIYGPESSGKTTLTLTIAANCQKNGGKAAFIDVEHAIDPTWCRTIGVNVKKLLFSQPDSAEDAFKLMHLLIDLKKVNLIILDSVAALATKEELSGEPGDVVIGAQARLMSQELRKIKSSASRNGVTVIFTNQMRDKIASMGFGPKTTTPGGRALKFYASQRIEIFRIGSTKLGEKVIGSKVQAKIVKNKVAPPFETALFDIIFNKGIYYPLCLIETGVKTGDITRKGSFYYFEDQNLGNGAMAAAECVESNEKLLEEIESKIRAKPKEESEEDEFEVDDEVDDEEDTKKEE
jgi:recombination protein RecA